MWLRATNIRLHITFEPDQNIDMALVHNFRANLTIVCLFLAMFHLCLTLCISQWGHPN